MLCSVPTLICLLVSQQLKINLHVNYVKIIKALAGQLILNPPRDTHKKIRSEGSSYIWHANVLQVVSMCTSVFKSKTNLKRTSHTKKARNFQRKSQLASSGTVFMFHVQLQEVASIVHLICFELLIYSHMKLIQFFLQLEDNREIIKIVQLASQLNLHKKNYLLLIIAS